MELRDYLQTLKIYWRSIVAATLAGFLAALGLTLIATPMYTSGAQILFTPVAGTGGEDLFYAATYASSRLPVYEELLESAPVLGPVKEALAQGGHPPIAGTELSGSHSSTKPILTVLATGPSAEQSARIAELASQTLITVVEELENPTVGEPSVMQGSIIVPASVPTATSNHQRITLVGGTLLGFLVGIAAAVVRRLASRPGKLTKSERS